MAKRLLALILLLCTILLYACSESETTSTETTTSVLQDAEKVYTDAYNQLLSQKDIQISVSYAQKVTVNGHTYSNHIERDISYNHIGSSDMIAYMTEKQTYDTYHFTSSLTYYNNIGYYSVAGGNFKTSVTAADFLKKHSASIALSSVLYSDISGTTDGATNVITFKNADSIEPWISTETPDVLSASGTAEISSDGRLLSCSYKVKYQQAAQIKEDDIHIQYHYTKPDIQMPNPDEFSENAHPDALILMEQAVGNLRQAKQITAKTEETISCEAYSELQDIRKQTTSLNLHFDEAQFLARLDILTSLSARAGEPTEQTQVIRFMDNKYQSSINGQPPETNPEITKDKMYTYCAEYLESTILMSKDITNISLTETDDLYILNFTASEDLATALRENICSTLYGQKDIFESSADSYKTLEISGYIQISKHSRLPVSSGITYKGVYSLMGYPYNLTLTTAQSYTIPSETAFDTINKDI